MAFREVRVIEVREVLRAWLAGAGRKLSWQGTGWAERGGGRPATAAGPRQDRRHLSSSSARATLDGNGAAAAAPTPRQPAAPAAGRHEQGQR